MMDIYKMQYIYRSRYLVKINKNAYVSVYKYEEIKFDQPFLFFQAKKIFIGKYKTCMMTEISGAPNNPKFDGNTILLEYEYSKNIYISRLEIFEFMTSVKIIDYVSLMGNNMTRYVLAVGSRYTYLISTQYKVIVNVKIEEGAILNSSNDSLDPYDYHLSKSGLDCFKKLLECKRIHSSWHGMECGFMEEIVEDEADVEDEEDVNIHELKYTNGDNEFVKTFNQKCVICLEQDSDYIFKQCGHQCICEEYYQNKGKIHIL